MTWPRFAVHARPALPSSCAAGDICLGAAAASPSFIGGPSPASRQARATEPLHPPFGCSHSLLHLFSRRVLRPGPLLLDRLQAELLMLKPTPPPFLLRLPYSYTRPRSNGRGGGKSREVGNVRWPACGGGEGDRASSAGAAVAGADEMRREGASEARWFGRAGASGELVPPSDARGLKAAGLWPGGGGGGAEAGGGGVERGGCSRGCNQRLRLSLQQG